MKWIAEIVRYHETNPDKGRLNYDIKLGKMHPQGQDYFLKELIFKIYRDEVGKTYIGKAWQKTNYGGVFYKYEDGDYWIEKVLKIYMSSWGESPDNPSDATRDQVNIFFQTYFYIQSLNRLLSNNEVGVNPEYYKFWSQFKKINPQTGAPFMTDEQVMTFLKQAFGNRGETKVKFNPDIKKNELRHAAWLFFNRFKKNNRGRVTFNKKNITRIMIDNFPFHFSDDPQKFQDEYNNIKDQTCVSSLERIFK